VHCHNKYKVERASASVYEEFVHNYVSHPQYATQTKQFTAVIRAEHATQAATRRTEERDPKGWSTVLVTALAGQLGETGHPRP
jgi:hypothetical protein